jgi:streptomycin 6-kinase
MIRIPSPLRDAVDEDDYPERLEWLAALPGHVEAIASEWSLALGDPYLPGGQCAWVAPATDPAGQPLALKVGWRHREAEHEADALRLWDGDGAVRCLATRAFDDTTVLLLERCQPGTPLGQALPEPEQDMVIAGLLRRLWEHQPPEQHPFQSLQAMCDDWADSSQAELETAAGGVDRGLVRAGLETIRGLPGSAERTVLLCTDLHAGNALASQRAPWLAIDPKPFLGDPAYDVVQHMLNCDERLATDPNGLARRMAQLLDLEPQRVKLWLFARCAQESLHDPAMRDPARRLAP